MKIYSESINISVPDKREVMRYMRAGMDIADELNEIIDTSISKIYGGITPRVCYAYLPIEIDGEKVIMGEMTLESISIVKLLSGCHGVCVFAATVGTEVDRIIRASSAISSALGLAVDAAGSAAVEEVCDELCSVLEQMASERGESITRRFSAGYGDLSLEYQRDIINLLQTKKHIGVSLSDGGMMTPTKSVTAIVGIKKNFAE